MSLSRLGRYTSLRLRPREENASRQTIPLFSSCSPLRIVPRFHPNSRSARHCPPSPSARTVRAINRRRALPLRSFAVSISNSLTSSSNFIFPSPTFFVDSLSPLRPSHPSDYLIFENPQENIFFKYPRYAQRDNSKQAIESRE